MWRVEVKGLCRCGRRLDVKKKIISQTQVFCFFPCLMASPAQVWQVHGGEEAGGAQLMENRFKSHLWLPGKNRKTEKRKNRKTEKQTAGTKLFIFKSNWFVRCIYHNEVSSLFYKYFIFLLHCSVNSHVTELYNYIFGPDALFCIVQIIIFYFSQFSRLWAAARPRCPPDVETQQRNCSCCLWGIRVWICSRPAVDLVWTETRDL